MKTKTYRLAAPNLRCLVFGDWGKPGQQLTDVANKMESIAKATKPHFALVTGDNFYEDGVESVNDPLWDRVYRGTFRTDSRPALASIPWFPCLGNHDHYTNPQAQIDYSKRDPLWRMLDQHYAITIEVEPSTAAIVNTPTRSPLWMLRTTPDKNINAAQDQTPPHSGAQKAFKVLVLVIDTYHLSRREFKAESKEVRAVIERVLQQSDADWKIVVGHYPIYSTAGHKSLNLGKVHLNRQKRTSVRSWLEKTMLDTGVDVYLSGHNHFQEYITVPSNTSATGYMHCIVSGSAGKVYGPSKDVEARNAAALDRTMSEIPDIKNHPNPMHSPGFVYLECSSSGLQLTFHYLTKWRAWKKFTLPFPSKGHLKT